MSAHSIRRDLLARMALPILVIMLLAGASAYGLARYFSQEVLDHWLHDSALSLASRVKWHDGRPSVDLPEGAREILEWDMVDRVYYEVLSARGERLVGNAILPEPPSRPAAGGKPLYYDARLRETGIRVLALALAGPSGEPVVVKLAETRLKRKALASQVLWISVAVSLLLAALSAAAIWYAIGRGIVSMESAIRAARRTHAGAPLTPIALDEAMPQEILPLVSEINDLIRDLAGAHRLNQRFIADASHQLRTPLATLRVQLELALREKDAARHRQALDQAVAVLGRLGRTLHQLLTLAKADETGGRAALAAAEVDIDLVAREEVERRLDEALAAGIDLGYAGAARPVRTLGVEELLREAVANLVDNALRYGGRGSTVTVGVACDPAEVYVEDNGPGIPQAERANVTQRFYRAPGAPGEGCGLGLSIVAEIVKRHGGALQLASAGAGGGLRARLVFASLSEADAALAPAGS